MKKSKLKLISLLLEDIIKRRNNQFESYNYDILEEEISEVLDWLFIREKGNKNKIKNIVFEEFQPYVDNKFFDNTTYYCMEHLFKFVKKQISKHHSFNTLDEDEKESIFEPIDDYLVIKTKEKITKKSNRVLFKSKLIYSYKQLKLLKANPNVKILYWTTDIGQQSKGIIGRVTYKEKVKCDS